jgi:hypothetical protein
MRWFRNCLSQKDLTRPLSLSIFEVSADEARIRATEGTKIGLSCFSAISLIWKEIAPPEALQALII